MNYESKVKDWELVDLGIDHEQYFAGFGVAFTDYTDCVVGIGDNPREALDDALENADQEIDIAEIFKLYPDFLDAAKMQAASVEPTEENEEQHYYIGLRWNHA